MRFFDLGDQAGLEEAVKIVNKIGYRTFGKSFEQMEVPELLIAADAADVTTNGKLDPNKAQQVIADGGVDLAFKEPPERAPRWMKLVWQKVTQRQSLAGMKKSKKKAPDWETAVPADGAHVQENRSGWKEKSIRNDAVPRISSSAVPTAGASNSPLTGGISEKHSTGRDAGIRRCFPGVFLRQCGCAATAD